MIRTHLLHGEGNVRLNVPLALACEPPADATVWVDLTAPNAEELALLSERWHFHPLAIEDVTHHQKRSKYERYPTHAFMITQALDRSTPHEPLDTVPIGVFLRPGLVVSVHPHEVAAIEAISRALATFPERVGSSSDRVVHAIVDTVIDEYTSVLYAFEERVDALEEYATRHYRPGLVEDLVRVRRDLLLLRRITLPQIEVVRRFVGNEGAEADGGARIYFRDVLDHLMIIQEQTGLLLEVCNGALQVHANAANERLNQVMKYMAIVSTLMLPMTVISGAFGMNFAVMPMVQEAHGFWVAIGMMVVSAGVLLAIFRVRRWF